MGFWTLFSVATMPVLQVLIISGLGAFLATGYCNLLVADARKHMNKIVFIVFTPSLMFASLAKSVTLEDIISWWFMPINIGLTFLFGGILGWIVVKILKPAPYLEGVVIATCSAGNLGNLMLIVVPAICKENGSPFGDSSICSVNAYSYASFSMALGGFYIWTYTYHLIRSAGEVYDEIRSIEESRKIPNKESDASGETRLLVGEDEEPPSPLPRILSSKLMGEDEEPRSSLTRILSSKLMGEDEEPRSPLPRILSSMKSIDESTENQPILQILSSHRLMSNKKVQFWGRVQVFLHQIIEEILAPPTVSAILGFIFGATPWLKSLLIGTNAPLRVIQDSIKLLGDGTIPCITLILGGNLTKGLRSGKLRPLIIISVIIVRYAILPIIGVGIVRGASKLGFLSKDPLYQYVLMVQYTLPPAMNIGTMTQLFDVGQEECSVLYLWTYLIAALAVTSWSTFYLWLLS